MKNGMFEVPDNFFEQGKAETMEACRKIRARRRMAAGALCAVAILLCCMWCLLPDDGNAGLLAADIENQEILDTYNNDIFLMNLTF